MTIRAPRPLAAAILAATVAAGLPAAAAPPPPPPEPAAVRAELLAGINALRRAEGLPELVQNEALQTAAQGHADDMTSRRYYGFTSPDGSEIEDWIAEAGYVAQLVTEKLVHSDLPPAEIVSGWSAQPDKQRSSLLHPDVEEIGIGIGTYVDLPVYAIALARSSERAVALRTDRERERLFASLTGSPGLLRERMKERISAQRQVAGLDRLKGNLALDRIAQAAAERTAASGASTDDGPSGATDVRRELLASASAAGYRPVQIARAVASGLVGVEEAVEGWLDDPTAREVLLSTNPLDIGVGLAADPAAREVHWVVVVARPQP